MKVNERSVRVNAWKGKMWDWRPAAKSFSRRISEFEELPRNSLIRLFVCRLVRHQSFQPAASSIARFEVAARAQLFPAQVSCGCTRAQYEPRRRESRGRVERRCIAPPAAGLRCRRRVP